MRGDPHEDVHDRRLSAPTAELMTHFGEIAMAEHGWEARTSTKEKSTHTHCCRACATSEDTDHTLH
eukprot:8524777-Alexandrium_andersonii.AAC.1